MKKEKQKKWKSLSPYAKAFSIFKDKKQLADLASELDIKSNAVMGFNDYLRLTRMDWLVKIYKELDQDLTLFTYLFRRIKKRDWTINKILLYCLKVNKNSSS